MPLQQLQKLQRFDLRAQLSDDEDDDRVSERKRSGEIVPRRCYEVGKGAGAVLLLKMCMFDEQLSSISDDFGLLTHELSGIIAYECT